MGEVSQSCGAFIARRIRYPGVHEVFSIAPSGRDGEVRSGGLCVPWSLPRVTRFEGGEVVESLLYPLGDVRNMGMKRGCHEMSRNSIDESRKWARYKMSEVVEG